MLAVAVLISSSSFRLGFLQDRVRSGLQRDDPETFPRGNQKIIWLSKDTPALLAAVASASKFVISGEIDIPGLDESDFAPISSCGDNRELRIRNLEHKARTQFRLAAT